MLRFLAIDFETTGSVAGYPVEPWQVGWVRMEEGRCTGFGESLLRVGPRPFHPKAPGRHEALRGELAHAPEAASWFADNREVFAGIALVGHNVATEKKMLRQLAPMENLGPWIDTLTLVRLAYPMFPSHRLEAVVEDLSLRDELDAWMRGRAPHDALYDAAASALVLRHLLQLPGWGEADIATLVHPARR